MKKPYYCQQIRHILTYEQSLRADLLRSGVQQIKMLRAIERIMNKSKIIKYLIRILRNSSEEKKMNISRDHLNTTPHRSKGVETVKVNQS